MGKWIVLPQDQIDEMVEVQAYIKKHQTYDVSVAEIRKLFGITSKEYEMVFDLTMELIRDENSNEYWKSKAQYIYSHTADRIRKRVLRPEEKMLGDKVWDILEEATVFAKKVHKKDFHKIKYTYMYNNLQEVLRGETSHLADDLRAILEEAKVGDLNVLAQKETA